MNGRIAVIGGGWYGCHITSSIMALGFECRLFEQHDQLLAEASGNNQFRLHLGFHYPRHASTRIQSRDGFSRFLERYGDLCRSIEENIYAVPTGTSLIDVDTYKLIMTATGIPYQPIEKCSVEVSNVDGMMQVEERVLLIDKARFYFSTHLSKVLQLSTRIEALAVRENYVEVNGERFDYVIDATWGHMSRLPFDVFYEPTLLLYLEGEPDFPALTFVDGPLYSIYPTEERTIYTLSSVPHTPIGRFPTAASARAARDGVDSALVRHKLHVMSEQVRENVPGFLDHFRFLGPQLSVKTKPLGQTADRSCYVGRHGRVFSVLSGKIDTIFFATERILSMIEADSGELPSDIPSSLRTSIHSQSKRIGL